MIKNTSQNISQVHIVWLLKKIITTKKEWTDKASSFQIINHNFLFYINNLKIIIYKNHDLCLYSFKKAQ